ncbi:uncharacterized protein LOC129919108 [Episyrphus balteatus]|uniref:uncharacterized protein LOC129919108 n=1 Tax=Episyrphus balteatus TaxID=286459 RepID=UPI002486CC9F|nr:uncharacterized protein LOC129919108 [Episyrphus balteatus]
MYTKIEQNSKPQITNMDCSENLSKDLELKLNIKGNNYEPEVMSPAEEEIMRCLRTSKARLEKVGSVDSAIDIDGEAMEPQGPSTKGRRLTLTITDLPLRPALLPIAEPNDLLDSPTTEVQVTQLTVPTSVSSRLLLEENVVEIPEERFVSVSRRQSAQSSLSDYQSSEGGGVVRFVRTPSVVVSDYSDEPMCGITQEEMEYFRAQRLRRRFSMETSSSSKKDDNTSDVSASSSCSNLYYSESKINPLPIDHKIPESSTYQATI